MVDTATMEHTDAREAGAEWLCLQAAGQLGLRGFLEGKGWSESKINTALSVLIAKTVYSPSELRTRRMSTQKLVTTKALILFDEIVETRIFSQPTKAAADIYDKLGYRHYPFRKMKICTTQTKKTDAANRSQQGY